MKGKGKDPDNGEDSDDDDNDQDEVDRRRAAKGKGPLNHSDGENFSSKKGKKKAKIDGDDADGEEDVDMVLDEEHKESTLTVSPDTLRERALRERTIAVQRRQNILEVSNRMREDREPVSILEIGVANSLLILIIALIAALLYRKFG